VEQNYASDIGTDVYKSNKMYWCAYLHYNVNSVRTVLHTDNLAETVIRKHDREECYLQDFVCSDQHPHFFFGSFLFRILAWRLPCFLKVLAIFLRLVVEQGTLKLIVSTSIGPQRNVK
jgi:hypothetical protein